MSGKRQHFIPQFLQRGFSYDNGKKQRYAWQYMNDGRILSSNIKNIGTEGYFYSVNSDHIVDDEITNSENVFSEVAQSLREGFFDDYILSKIPELISHLEMRTRHVRKSFYNSSAYLLKLFEKKFLSNDILTNYFHNKVISDPSFFEGMLTTAFDNLKIPDFMRKELRKSVELNFMESLPALVDSLIVVLKPQLSSAIANDLVSAVKNGHVKAFVQDVYSPIKVIEYSKLDYSIVTLDYPLPLGDSLVIFEVNNIKNACKPFFETDDDLTGVYLPLSSQVLLCGCPKGCSPTLKDIDLRIAECSLEFFVAQTKSERFEYIHSKMGITSSLISPDEIDVIFNNLIDIKLHK